MSKPLECKYADGTSCMAFTSRTFNGDCTDWYDLAEFSGWLADLTGRIPAKYRDSARIKFEAQGSGEFDREVEVSVCYWKPTQE